MKILQKNKSLLFSISLIIVGSFLEIYYYTYRFHLDGISIWLSIVIGIALTLLLSLAVYKRKQRIMWLIIIPVSIYSILATSAGQSFSLGIIEEVRFTEQASQEYIQEEITEYKNQILLIDTEILKINNQIAGTVDSLEDRYEWKFTLANAEERIDILKNEKESLKTKLSEYRSKATIHDDIETANINIYEFYHKLFGWEKNMFQFILHTILSAFIAAMAPIGIITLSDKNIGPVKNKPAESINKFIGRWVTLNWAGYRTGRSETILHKKVFDEFMKKNNESFSTQKYNLILKAAQESKALDGFKFKVDQVEAEKLIKKVLTKNK